MAGSVSVLVYLDEGFVTLSVFITDQKLCHVFMHFRADLRNQGIHPGDGCLFGQGNVLHHVIPGLPVKRKAEDKLPVEDICDNGIRHKAFIDQRVHIRNSEQIMLQAD